VPDDLVNKALRDSFAPVGTGPCAAD